MNKLIKRQEQQKELILEQLKKTPIVQLVCEKVGVSRATFYRWKSEDTQFGLHADKALLSGKLLINDMAESQLISAIKEKNLTAIIFWLKHHHNDYRNQLDVTGEITTKVDLSSEQKETVLRALSMALLPDFNTPNPSQDES